MSASTFSVAVAYAGYNPNFYIAMVFALVGVDFV
jgi:hypothetical protein